MPAEYEQLAQAIATLEAQRATLGDAVVDAALGPMQRELAEFEAQDAPASQQRKQVTVLFADVSGFTAMSETLDAEVVTETMNAVWQQLDSIIVEHGGTIDKHIGDAVMALWGVRAAREDDPPRAIRAGLAMQDALASLADDGPALQMRTGINTGPVVLGEVGTQGEFTAIGDTVNLASRLEQAAPVGRVLISHETYRHVTGAFEVAEQAPVMLKGKSEPVKTYVVHSARARAFFEPSRGVEGVTTTLVGREAEMDSLRQKFAAVSGGAGANFVTVAGEAGVGKSRLVHEFSTWLDSQPDGAALFMARARHESQSLPYSLWRDLFRYRFGIRDSDAPAEVIAKFRDGMSKHIPPERADLVGHFVGFDFSSSAAVAKLMATNSLATLAQADLTHYLDSLLDAQPLVLLLEDVHWADEGSIGLLKHVLRELKTERLLVVALARPQLFERWPEWEAGFPGASRLELESLSPEASHQLVHDILRHVENVPESLHALVVRGAEGNPFYVEELVKMLIDEGAIVRDEEVWRLVKQPGEIHVPSTLTGILQARLDSLPPDEREALQLASVVGRQFWDQTVAAMAEQQDANATLGRAQGRELIFRQAESAFANAGEYLFKHAMLREVVYETVLLKLRRQHHTRVAQWLEENAGERVNEFLSLIAHHYELAGENALAADYLVRSGEELVKVANFRSAWEVLARAQDLLPDDQTETQVRLLRLMGDTRRNMGEFAEALALYEQGLPDARAAGNKLELAHLLNGSGETASLQGNFGEARTYLEEAIAVARDAGLPDLQAVAQATLGSVYRDTGEFDKGIELLEEAQAIAAKTESLGTLRYALDALGTTLFETGRREEGLARLEESLTVAHALGDRKAVASARNHLAHYNNVDGRPEDAITHARFASKIFEEIGDKFSCGLAVCTVGQISETVDQNREAADRFREAMVLFQETGSVPFEVAMVAMMGLVHAKSGQLELALNYFGFALFHETVLPQVVTYLDPYLADLNAELGEEFVAAGLEKGRDLNLDDLRMAILDS